MGRKRIMTDAAVTRAAELAGGGMGQTAVTRTLIAEGLVPPGTNRRTVGRANERTGAPRRRRQPAAADLRAGVAAAGGSLEALQQRAEQIQRLASEASEAREVRSFAALVKLEAYVTQQIVALTPVVLRPEDDPANKEARDMVLHLLRLTLEGGEKPEPPARDEADA